MVALQMMAACAVLGAPSLASAAPAGIRQAEPQVEEPCTKAVGHATFKTASEKTSIRNELSTELSQRQLLLLKFEKGEQTLKLTQLTAATCTITDGRAVFEGDGSATLNGEEGYTVHFKLVRVAKTQRFAVHARITKPEEETIRVNASASSVGSEEIS
ncbi:MAG TPA: hypothetical protein VHT25_02555 [Solirubrobacteraceae bacterium]|nr:hypothetical protein [Solirubrobacteraceae bacterium]